MNKSIDKYPYIYAWQKMLGAYNYYIEAQLEKAEKDNAPKNAIFKRYDGSYATIEKLDKFTIQKLDNYIEGKRGGIGK